MRQRHRSPRGRGRLALLLLIALLATFPTQAAGHGSGTASERPAVAPSPSTAPPATAGRREGALQRDRSRMVRALLELDARDLSGRTWSYAELRGRVVLLDFWATWCPPCLREIPNLRELRARHGRDDFLILGISLDAMPRRELRSWLDRHDVDWPQIHQDGAFDDRIPLAFGIDRLPTSLLLDRDGRVRAFDLRGEDLVRAVEELIAVGARD